MKLHCIAYLLITSLLCFSCQKQDPIGHNINSIITQTNKHIASNLSTAAKKAGIDIDTSNLFIFSRSDVVFILASRTGLEDTPVPQMLNGGILGFGYLEVPDTKIEKGYYTFKVNTKDEIRQDDTISVAVDLIGLSGNVEARVAGTAEIFSFELPSRPREVVLSGGISIGIKGNPGNKKPREKRFLYYCCKNGSVVCYDLDSPLPPG